jgi:hypothetical protein
MSYVRNGIMVVFANGEIGDVHGYMLDYLIREKRIFAFLRSDEVVQIDRDPIRSTQQPLARAGNRRSDAPPV